MFFRSKYHKGFTLLELSIVLLVLSLVAGGLLVGLTQNIRLRKETELQRKMDAIEGALLKYRRINNRLPCPADGTLETTDSNFAQEAASPGLCTSGNPAANFDDDENTVGGVAPVRTLGLQDEFLFDPWGGRFTYVVDKRMTENAAFITYPVTDTSIGSVTINDSEGNDIVTNAVTVLISHGNNGHGAYQLNGVRKSARSTNTSELTNCHCDINAETTTFDPIFIMQPSTGTSANISTGYDDTIRYWLRSHLYSANDIGMR